MIRIDKHTDSLRLVLSGQDSDREARALAAAIQHACPRGISELTIGDTRVVVVIRNESSKEIPAHVEVDQITIPGEL